MNCRSKAGAAFNSSTSGVQVGLVPTACTVSLVVGQPPHHVEVQIGRDLVVRHRRGFHEVGRPEESELLARPEGQDDPARTLELSQAGAGGEDRRHPRCIVVGAVVNLARLVTTRQGVPPPAPRPKWS